MKRKRMAGEIDSTLVGILEKDERVENAVVDFQGLDLYSATVIFSDNIPVKNVFFRPSHYKGRKGRLDYKSLFDYIMK